MKFLIACLAAMFFLPSCKNNDVKPVNEANEIWYDYKVSAEEGAEEVTVLVHYRDGEPTGDALPLDGSVALDGVALQGDSTQYTGTFYETVRPLQGFAGKHSITTKVDGKEQKQEFDFVSFSLETELPASVRKAPFVIQLKDFPAAPTAVRLVVTDTAFATPDVNEEMKIVKGKIEVNNAMLEALAAGPVSIEIYREEEVPVRKNGLQVGRLMLTYGLKREIELVQ